MSLISKLLVKFNPITIFITPNVVKEMRRNISKRYTIGQDCHPESEPGECPDPCRRVKIPLSMPQYCMDRKKRSKTKTEPESDLEDADDFGDASYSIIYKRDPKVKGVKKPGKYTTSKCDPFPRDEHEFKKKLIRCKPSMRHPCDPPVPEHLCSVTKGKLLYTTNERPKQKLPNCPKGNWNYSDRHNKTH